MRNILYICTKNKYDWNTFIPETDSAVSEMDPTVLLLQNGLDLQHVPTSNVCVLCNEGEREEDSRSYEPISYQGFLEKIFLADLALVI
ncbi:hypothetical protein [Candidatus Nitrospira neomarina]|uniref:Uncharacterized protein n=1 Tax=Candidatus Nitrospira neomarina TaxID=3020899 RepID=A0AA96GG52_9BACT|nr:hypothetical protein [Candidatus Nitrospira neomarina]WNM61161.1 hypothetical protein PQG83_15560 [Candidatus Nitrospira neomarina]